MNTMIASGQQENAVNMIAAAARKNGEEAIDELATNGVLTSTNFQRVIAQGDKIGAVVKAALLTALAELAESVVGRLKRICTDRVHELKETNGKETLANSQKSVFPGGIYNAKKRGPCTSTAKTAAAVYEMIKDGTYAQLFGGFGENLKRLCWTESQIVAFCRDFRHLLRTDRYGTLFLFEEENGDFSVAYVCVLVDGRLFVDVDPLDYGGVWRARYPLRVIVPQL